MKLGDDGCSDGYHRHRCLHYCTLLRPVRIAHARHQQHCATRDCSEERHRQHCRSYLDDYPHQHHYCHVRGCHMDYRGRRGY